MVEEQNGTEAKEGSGEGSDQLGHSCKHPEIKNF